MYEVEKICSCVINFKYCNDYSDYDDSYWKENAIIVELTNDEIFKLIQELTNYQELISKVEQIIKGN